MKVEEKPYLKTHGNGKPYFDWWRKGTSCPTLRYERLISHVAMCFKAHNKDITYIPSDQEMRQIARAFARWEGDVYANVDEMHWKAVHQQLKWLFTEQDLSHVDSKHMGQVRLHYIGMYLLEKALK